MRCGRFRSYLSDSTCPSYVSRGSGSIYQLMAAITEKIQKATHAVVTAAPSSGRNHAIYPVHGRRCGALSPEGHARVDR
jgi:hypothetical protein